MSLSRVLQIIKYLVLLSFVWLIFLGYQIAAFPVGSLVDEADAAIVLGAAVDNEKPSPVFAERIKHAINLYQSGKVKKIVFTGGFGENKEYAESLVARAYAIEQGIPQKNIFTEIESRTTRDNLVQAQKLLKAISKDNELVSTLVISDPLHLKRAMLIAKDIGITGTKPSATPTSRYKSLKTKLPFLFREIYFYHHYMVFNE